MNFFCSGGFNFKWENVIFVAYFILRGRDMHIDFLQLLFLVGVICPGDLPSDGRTFITAKKAHRSSARRGHVKDQKTCLQENILIKLRATCWPKKRCKSNLCSRQWELASGSDAQRVLWNDSPKCLSTDSHPLPSLFSRFFSPFPQTESLFTGYHRPEACIPIFSMIFCLFFCFSINFYKVQKGSVLEFYLLKPLITF